MGAPVGGQTFLPSASGMIFRPDTGTNTPGPPPRPAPGTFARTRSSRSPHPAAPAAHMTHGIGGGSVLPEQILTGGSIKAPGKGGVALPPLGIGTSVGAGSIKAPGKGGVALPTLPRVPAAAPMGAGGGGGFSASMPRQERPRIDAHATPAMTTAGWIAQNEANGGHGLTPNYGPLLPPMAQPQPQAQPQPSTQAAPAGTTSAPRMMANGGMTKGPAIVGEKGPEMVIPRADGSVFVLPNDVTRQIVPMAQDKFNVQEPSPGMRYAQGPYGTGYAAETPKVNALPGFASDGQTTMSLGGPLNPMVTPIADPLAGTPWGTTNGLLPPLDTQALLQDIAHAAMQMERFGLPTFQNAQREAAMQSQLQHFDLAARGAEAGQQLNQMQEARFQAGHAASLPVPFSAEARGQMPLQPMPGMDRTQRRMERNTRAFLESPQGAVWNLEQQRQQQMMDNRLQAAQQVLPIRDEKGNVLGYVNGLGQRLSADARQAPDSTLNALLAIMQDANQPTEARETARRQYSSLTGVDLPMPVAQFQAPKLAIAPNADTFMNQSLVFNPKTGSYEPYVPPGNQGSPPPGSSGTRQPSSYLQKASNNAK